MTSWQKCNGFLPLDNQLVLLHALIPTTSGVQSEIRIGYVSAGRWAQGIPNCFSTDFLNDDIAVTHWSVIPTPPSKYARI